MRLFCISTISLLALGCSPKWAEDTEPEAVQNEDVFDGEDGDQDGDGSVEDDIEGNDDDGAGTDGDEGEDVDEDEENGGDDVGDDGDDTAEEDEDSDDVEGEDVEEDEDDDDIGEDDDDGGDDIEGDGGDDGDDGEDWGSWTEDDDSEDDDDDSDGDGDEIEGEEEEDIGESGDDIDDDGDEVSDDGGDIEDAEPVCEDIESILTEDLEDATGDELVWGYSDEVEDDLGSGCFSDADAGEGVYWWTAPETGCYNINTNGSEIDTVLSLRDTCTLEEFDCHDDVVPRENQVSEIISEFVEGEEMIISVDKWAYDDDGLFILNIEALEDGIAADEDVGDITGDYILYGSTSASSTFEGGCDDDEGSGPDTSFLWTAPSDGCWEFSSELSTFDTVLRLYDPNASVCSDSGEIACQDDADDDDTTSRLQATLDGGEQYIVVVDGYDDADGGLFTLSIMECGSELAEDEGDGEDAAEDEDADAEEEAEDENADEEDADDEWGDWGDWGDWDDDDGGGGGGWGGWGG